MISKLCITIHKLECVCVCARLSLAADKKNNRSTCTMGNETALTPSGFVGVLAQSILHYVRRYQYPPFLFSYWRAGKILVFILTSSMESFDHNKIRISCWAQGNPSCIVCLYVYDVNERYGERMKMKKAKRIRSLIVRHPVALYG